MLRQGRLNSMIMFLSVCVTVSLGTRLVWWTIIIITSRPHGQVIFQGTGNKYIVSHGLIADRTKCSEVW